jgi:AcrR family transcriptional regulator
LRSLQQTVNWCPVTGLRERKKQRTRETIVREAFRLFAARGFDATTIADIAEAADIAPRTFFAYFETKEAVVFHDFDEVHARFADRLRSRAHGETTFDTLRGWVADLVEHLELLEPDQYARRELIRSTPALRAHDQGNRAVFERLVAQSVAEDLGLPASALRPRMVAAAAVAALGALADVEQEGTPDAAQAMAIVDEALAFLEGGLETLRARPLPDGSVAPA